MSVGKSVTVGELKKLLAVIPNKTEIIVSSDSEQNSYGTINLKHSVSYNKEDNKLVLGMWEDHLYFEDVMPILDAKISKELEEEENARRNK